MNATAIPTYWFRRRPNFGDALSPYIVSALSGRTVAFSAASPRLVALGSVLNAANDGDVIWGAGFRDARHTCARRISLRAVRGPLTRRRLCGLGVVCPEVYGDPAMLLPYIHRPVIRPAARRVGVIPHFVDFAILEPLAQRSNVCLIDVRDPIMDVIDQLLSCSVVLSSSLHGLIVAEAYGRPAAWVLASDKVLGNGFKFKDYYLATGRTARNCDWRGRVDWDRAVALAQEMPAPRHDADALLASFPFLKSGVGSSSDLLTTTTEQTRG